MITVLSRSIPQHLAILFIPTCRRTAANCSHDDVSFSVRLTATRSQIGWKRAGVKMLYKAMFRQNSWTVRRREAPVRWDLNQHTKAQATLTPNDQVRGHWLPNKAIPLGDDRVSNQTSDWLHCNGVFWLPERLTGCLWGWKIHTRLRPYGSFEKRHHSLVRFTKESCCFCGIPPLLSPSIWHSPCIFIIKKKSSLLVESETNWQHAQTSNWRLWAKRG
jgi:hypothetical protein